jgi:transcriptional regulator with XRE-family HTH domain
VFDESITVVRRAREGSGRTQAEAARALGFGRATLSIYESGRSVPSQGKLWQILAGLAIGNRAAEELRPHLLVSFSLAGQRLLAVGGALLDFASPENAAAAADELDDCQLDRVVVVPAWTSALTNVLSVNAGRPGTSAGVVVFEELNRPLEDVLDQALRELIEHVQPWFKQAIAGRLATPPRQDRR